MLSKLAVDQVLCGRYRLRGVLGKGGMGVVFKAEDLALKRLVALKLVEMDADQHDAVEDEERHRGERFVREASINAQIAHPNVVTIYDYGRGQEGEKSFCYIAMELLSGETLGERLRRQPTGLEVTEIATFAAQIGRGLRAAHQRGLVHRDLKPDNVMLTPGEEGEEVARILDFGLAKDLISPHARSLTDAGVVMGTPEYMAPEQVQAAEVDGRTDLYALGVLLYESVTGAPPFKFANAFKTAAAHVRERVPEMSIPKGKSPPSKELKEIIFKLLAKRPADRIQTADELVRLLRDIPEMLAVQTRTADNVSLVTESRYQTGRKLAQTPRSIVYEATHLELGRQVIVKVYRAVVLAEVTRLKRELPSIALLRHPCNARIYDIGMTAKGPEGLPFIVMERVRGVPLRSVIAKQGSLPWRQAVDLIVGVLEGLAEAHAMGVLHRHLTPDHIIVPTTGARRETAKIIGYRVPEGAIDGSEPRVVSLPDPTYMAPEVFRGAPMSERVDLYAVAVMLHELVLGRPPAGEFLSPNVGAADPTPRDDIPPYLADIVRRSVSLDPGERYSSAAEFGAALQSVKATLRQDPITNEPDHDARISYSQRRLRSTGQPTVWFLAGDPALRKPEVKEVLLSLRTTMRVEEIAQDHRAALADRILSEEEIPPWVVVFGGLQVILEDPLLAALAQTPEVSRVLISTHMNTELLDTAINFSGLDHHIQLPSTPGTISTAVERMAARAGAARRYYDDLRLMAQQSTPSSRKPARVSSRA